MASYRVLWVCEGTERYGVASVILTLASLMQQRGHEVRVLAIGAGYLTQQCAARGLPCLQLEAAGVSQFGGRLSARIKGVVRAQYEARQMTKRSVEMLGAWQPQAVHCVRPNMLSFAVMLSRRIGAQAIWEMPNLVNRTLPFDMARRYYGALCRFGRVIALANSRYTAATLVSNRVTPVVFYPAVDDAIFDPERVVRIKREEVGFKADDIVLGIVARVYAPKGQDRVAEAVLKLAGRHPKLKLALCGGPVESQFVRRIQQRAHEAGLAERIRFLGPVVEAERYYPMMDLSINSRVDPEPFGLSVVESMLMRTPVLVHALGGPAETVLDGKTGWHVAEASVAAFQAGIERALSERADWGAMAARCRRHAVVNFGGEARVGQYLDILSRALN